MYSRLFFGLAACTAGLITGAATLHAMGDRNLAREQAAHARDAKACAQKILELSEKVAKATTASIAANKAAAARIYALDQQLHAEKALHEADNAKNRIAIADGTRRLRIKVSGCADSNHNRASNPSARTGGMGDGAGAHAELSPAAGAALFAIVDDADKDARAKAEYLQRYVCALQREEIVVGRCSDSISPN